MPSDIGQGVALFVAAAATGLVVWVLRRAGGRDSPGPGAGPRQLNRAARRLAAAGKANKAADLLLRAGDEAAAIQVLQEARLFSRAGHLLERTGDLEGALEAFEAGHESLASAKVLERLGALTRAGARYEQAGRPSDAARCWGAVGQHSRAGTAWRISGDMEKAGDAYAARGDSREAALAYQHALGEADGERVFDGYELIMTSPHIARKCGECWLAASEPGRAADVFTVVGLDEEAATAFELAGNLVGAAAARARIEDWAGAATLLERAGRPDEAAGYRARVHQSAGEFAAAADLLERSGAFREAAELRSRTGDHSGAAQLHERVHSWGAAATAWEQAGVPDRAAHALELAGHNSEAAGLYRDAGLVTSELRLRELSGEWLRVGELRLHKGNLDGAEHALKQVEVADVSYRTACRLLGEVYRAKGDWAAAAVKFQLAVDGLRPKAEDAQWRYLGGDCAIRAGLWRIGVSMLSDLRGFDPTYRDVLARFEQAQRGLADEMARAGTGAAAGRYRRIEEVGRGGMGTVWRAFDIVLEREVAYKTLSVRATGRTNAREWLLREARSTASLNHPRIVTIHDFGANDNELFIAMEFVTGRTLVEVLASKSLLSIPVPSSSVQPSRTVPSHITPYTSTVALPEVARPAYRLLRYATSAARSLPSSCAVLPIRASLSSMTSSSDATRPSWK